MCIETVNLRGLITKQYLNRIDSELKVLGKYPDFINSIYYVKKFVFLELENDLFYPRGLISNSLVLFLLGFTPVNPIKYKLSFSLFKGFLENDKRILSYNSTIDKQLKFNDYSIQFYPNKKLIELKQLNIKDINFENVLTYQIDNVASKWATNKNLVSNSGRHILTFDEAVKYKFDNYKGTKLKNRGYLIPKGQAIIETAIENEYILTTLDKSNIYNGNILVYGPPGSGKSFLLHKSEETIQNKSDDTVLISDPKRVEFSSKNVKAFNDVLSYLLTEHRNRIANNISNPRIFFLDDEYADDFELNKNSADILNAIGNKSEETGIYMYLASQRINSLLKFGNNFSLVSLQNRR